MAAAFVYLLEMVTNEFSKIFNIVNKMIPMDFYWFSIPFKLNHFFMLRAKALLVFFIFLFLFSWFTSSGIWKRIKANNSFHSEKEYYSENAEIEKLKKKSTGQ